MKRVGDAHVVLSIVCYLRMFQTDWKLPNGLRVCRFKKFLRFERQVRRSVWWCRRKFVVSRLVATSDLVCLSAALRGTGSRLTDSLARLRWALVAVRHAVSPTLMHGTRENIGTEHVIVDCPQFLLRIHSKTTPKECMNGLHVSCWNWPRLFVH